ncbi:MAG: hydroxylamine reductase [Acidaminococcaceae bacterium]
MEKMFCFQCEQTAAGSGCTISGVCGKKPPIANLQDVLTGVLVSLAQSQTKGASNEELLQLFRAGLFTTITNVNFEAEALEAQIAQAKLVLKQATGTDSVFDMNLVWQAQEDIRSLKALILFGLKGIAAYAYHAQALGYEDARVNTFFGDALRAIGDLSLGEAELLPLVLATGEANLQCMELLAEANTHTYGVPAPRQVTMTVEAGPFIVVTGHDLLDLQLLLEQTEGKGINIYTHGEMLPCHAYPGLNKFPHLKGNFGTAWQNQQREFADLPAPILYTTNCIMPVQASYSDRVFTTAVVAYPQMQHIGEAKDFTPVIARALALGGYGGEKHFHGINGGEVVTTGFGQAAILAAAPQLVAAVKAGTIKHFFLVGGCDGAKVGRNYYTEFVKQTPPDTLVLTLACGKYRFNDLDLGTVAGFPRILDMGQCNDAYGAIQVALALAKAFECEVNELPLTLVLSWYEQKAVGILLTLLALGIKNIYLGPTLPAFVSPHVLDVLVQNYNLMPISTPEADLKKILG